MYFVFFLCSCYSVYFFFFFQAEDGIRDTSVTGVQTCALPILIPPTDDATGDVSFEVIPSSGPWKFPRITRRSEERRVGKECRTRWQQCHEKKKRMKNRDRTSREKAKGKRVCEQDAESGARGGR